MDAPSARSGAAGAFPFVLTARRLHYDGLETTS